MYAKHDGVCKETKNKIKEGDIIVYLPPVKELGKYIAPGRVFCVGSEMFKLSATSLIDTAWDISDEDQENLKLK